MAKPLKTSPTAQYAFKSTLGTIYLLASDLGLQGVHFNKQAFPLTATLDDKNPAHKILKQTCKQLEEYFQGKRKDFDLALDFSGTDFQNKVWNQLQKIPYGKTWSYKDLAKKIKNDKAVRAVGTANGKNPLCIIIPCHRVIAADGTLGGYSAGLKIKTQLLDLENQKSV